MNEDTPENPFEVIARERKERAAEHASYRESEPFKTALRRMARMLWDYGLALNAIDLMATRYPPYFDTLITLRLKQHFVQSMISAVHLIKEGFHNPARRELRFLLEASVKTLWLDCDARTERTRNGRRETVKEKVSVLDDLGAERFSEIVKSLNFGLIDTAGTKVYRQTALSLYGSLSTHVHVSKSVINRDFKRFDRDQDFGFESVRDVNAIADLLRNVLDLALASHFEAFDHGLVGDLFVGWFDDLHPWTFRKTPLVAAVSRHFDYKAERQAGW